VARISSWIWHDEGRISLTAQYSKKKYYGRWVAEYFSRAPQARSHVARPGVLKQPGKVLRHPTRAAGMIMLKSVEAAGLYAGMRSAKRSGLVGSAEPSGLVGSAERSELAGVPA
jgi:hypothetical protein